jgi:hypothetical protein
MPSEHTSGHGRRPACPSSGLSWLVVGIGVVRIPGRLLRRRNRRAAQTGALSASEKMKLTAQQRAVRLQLYGLVRSLSYVVRLSDLKTTQHFRARLAWVLRRPHDIAKPLHGDLKELFDISGLWVRNVGERHDLKMQIQRLIRRIVQRVKVQRRNRRRVRRRLT